MIISYQCTSSKKGCCGFICNNKSPKPFSIQFQRPKKSSFKKFRKFAPLKDADIKEFPEPLLVLHSCNNNNNVNNINNDNNDNNINNDNNDNNPNPKNTFTSIVSGSEQFRLMRKKTTLTLNLNNSYHHQNSDIQQTLSKLEQQINYEIGMQVEIDNKKFLRLSQPQTTDSIRDGDIDIPVDVPINVVPYNTGCIKRPKTQHFQNK
jgi:hypothetical protein